MEKKKNEKYSYVIMEEYRKEGMQIVISRPVAVIIAKNVRKAVEFLGGELGKFDAFRSTDSVHGAWGINFSFDRLKTNTMWEMHEYRMGIEPHQKTEYSFTFREGRKYFGEGVGELNFTLLFNEEKQLKNKYWIQLASLLS
jgi:hypothetical protein